MKVFDVLNIVGYIQVSNIYSKHVLGARIGAYTS